MKKLVRFLSLSTLLFLISGCTPSDDNDSDQTDSVSDITATEEDTEVSMPVENETEEESLSNESADQEQVNTVESTDESTQDPLENYSSQEIEYARVWIQLGGNTEELEQLNVQHIKAGTEIAPEGYFDFSMPVFSEDVILLTGIRLVDGSVTYSGNGDGTVNVYNLPTRFDRSDNMTDDEYAAYWEEMMADTDIVYIEPGDPNEVAEYINLLHYSE